MALVTRAEVMIAVLGDNLVPERVTAILGIAPTRARRKGDMITSGRGVVPHPVFSGYWYMDSGLGQESSIDEQMASIISHFPDDVDRWHRLGREFSPELRLSLFLKGANEALELSSSTLQWLADRGIRIVLDIYTPLLALEDDED